MNSILEDVRQYERWLRKQCAVVDSDIEEKHKRMRRSAFDFLRATYFRWARIIEVVCGDLPTAPRVMSVGDMHVENFGTWRDADGRPLRDVNDFDKATVMPYPYDLVRPATSALLAPRIDLTPAYTARAVAGGYARGLAGACPTLLDQHAQQLRPFADGDVAANRKFWQSIAKCPEAKPPRPCDEFSWEASRKAPASSVSTRAKAAPVASGDPDTWRSPSGVPASSCARRRHSCPRLGRRRTAKASEPKSKHLPAANIVRPTRLCARVTSGLRGDWRPIRASSTSEASQNRD